MVDYNRQLDLIVRNGALVIPGVGQVKADVGIADGKIAALGYDWRRQARKFTTRPGEQYCRAFSTRTFILVTSSLTKAKPRPRPAPPFSAASPRSEFFLRSLEDSYFQHLPAFCKAMNERSYVDLVLNCSLLPEQQIEEIPGYAEQYGIRSFKFYMSGMPGIVKSVTDDVLREGFRAVASLGRDAVACVHCETGALIDRARNELKLRKPEGTLPIGKMRIRLWRKRSRFKLRCISPRSRERISTSSICRAGMDLRSSALRAGMQFTVETTTPSRHQQQ